MFIRRIFPLELVLTLLLLYILLAINGVYTQSDVKWCSGSLVWTTKKTSHPPTSTIDFTQFKVQLVSEQTGAVKESVDLLPYGAFFVPIYQPLTYRIKLVTSTIASSSSDWHVEPVDGFLIDLVANPEACSEELVFQLAGFTVSGQVVTYGLDSGPEGLPLQLVPSSSTSPAAMMHAKTDQSGRFSFSPVLPGSYLIQLSSSSIKSADQSTRDVKVDVVDRSIQLAKPFVLMGHAIRGQVIDFSSRPLANYPVGLLSSARYDKKSAAAITCRSSSTDLTQLELDLLSTSSTSGTATAGSLVCEVLTDANGWFSFNQLPGGHYLAMPRIGASSPPATKAITNLFFEPAWHPVQLKHADSRLDAFQAVAFTPLPGRVVWLGEGDSPQKEIGLTNATVIVKSMTDSSFKTQTTTAQDGSYSFVRLSPGKYSFMVEPTPEAEFDLVNIDLNPGGDDDAGIRLPRLRPAKMALGGQLKVMARSFQPTDLNSLQSAHVRLTGESIKEPILLGLHSVPSSSDDHLLLQFHTLLPIGRYLAEPFLIDPQTEKPIQFAPPSLNIDLTKQPFLSFDASLFSEFLVNLTGSINYLAGHSTREELESSLLVRIKSSSGSLDESIDVQFVNDNDQSSFHRLRFHAPTLTPGRYDLELLTLPDLEPLRSWCWQSSTSSSSWTSTPRQSLLLTEQSDQVSLIQTGFLYRVSIPPEVLLSSTTTPANSNKVTLKVTRLASSITELTFDLVKPISQICLPTPNPSDYLFEASTPCLELVQVAVTSSSQSTPPLVHLRPSRIQLGVSFYFADSIQDNAFLMSHYKDLLFGAKSPRLTLTLSSTSEDSQPTRIDNVSWIKPRSSSPTPTPIASAVLWINSSSSLRLTPSLDRMSSPDDLRHHSLRLLLAPESVELTNTPSFSIDAPLSQPSNVDDQSLELTAPLSVDATTSSNKRSSSSCSSSTSSSQLTTTTVNFSLVPALMLVGRVEPAPPVNDKVLVEVHRPLAGPDDSPTNQQLRLEPVSSTDHSSSLIASTFTNSQGFFSLGPFLLTGGDSQLPRSVDQLFQLKLSCPGYEFNDSRRDLDSSGNALADLLTSSAPLRFTSVKLAMVEVVVIDEDSRQPVGGVLVSIVGQKHRGSALTDHQSGGLVRFIGLAPGQYYISPILKEYVFTLATDSSSDSIKRPPSIGQQQHVPVTVLDGVSSKFNFRAHRFAFSAHGLVSSLNLKPEANVIVEARRVQLTETDPDWSLVKRYHDDHQQQIICPSSNQDEAREQVITDSQGRFRLLGLLPGCIYAISILDSSSSNSIGPSSVPSRLLVEMPRRDVDGLHFYAMLPSALPMSMLSVYVDTPSVDLLTSLTVSLYRSDKLQSPELAVARHHFGGGHQAPDYNPSPLVILVSSTKMASLVGHNYTLVLESSSLDPLLYSTRANGVFKQQRQIELDSLTRSVYVPFKFRPQLRQGQQQSSARSEL